MGNESKSAFRKYLALVLLCTASFIAVLDLTIVAIALPSIKQELGFSGGDAQWILNAYSIVFGGLLLLAGRAGDLYGRRRLFMVGLALFALASLVGGLSWEPWILVAARALQGVGGAALVPSSLSLVTTMFAEGPERNRALGVYGAVGAIGFVAGMVLGGAITEFLGWRWVFFVSVPVAIVVLLLAPTAVTESRAEGGSRVLDLPGAATVTLGVASLIYAISEIPKNGWTSPETLAFAMLGVLLMSAFVFVELHSTAPLVPLAVFRLRAITVPNAAMILKSCVGVSWLFVLTLYFQDMLGYGPLKTGLLLPSHDAGLRRRGPRRWGPRDPTRHKADRGPRPLAAGYGAATPNANVSKRRVSIRDPRYGGRRGGFRGVQCPPDDRRHQRG
jgi:EmrB/QacA subfamily drug resistance transporter